MGLNLDTEKSQRWLWDNPKYRVHKEENEASKETEKE